MGERTLWSGGRNRGFVVGLGARPLKPDIYAWLPLVWVVLVALACGYGFGPLMSNLLFPLLGIKISTLVECWTMSCMSFAQRSVTALRM